MIGFLISHLFCLCILKSEFDIVAELSCVYGEIDAPTEKERAEINEINSRTAMNYINSGAVSPDKIRDVLREDTNSAFNALEGDAPNDPIDFDPDNDPYQDLNRGSPNGQHPFKSVSRGEAQCLALSETVDDRRYDRSDFGSEGNEAIFDCTGGKSVSRGEAQYSTLDEWSETDHPRKPNGQFGEGGGKVEKSQRSDKIRKRTRKEVQLPKDEYAKVIHELNSNLPSELKNKKIFRRSIGNYTYKIQNNGFNEYKIIGKQEINEMFD